MSRALGAKMSWRMRVEALRGLQHQGADLASQRGSDTRFFLGKEGYHGWLMTSTGAPQGRDSHGVSKETSGKTADVVQAGRKASRESMPPRRRSFFIGIYRNFV